MLGASVFFPRAESPKQQLDSVAERTPIVLGCTNGCAWRDLDERFLSRAGFVPVPCSQEVSEVLACCGKLVPCILVVDAAFVDRVDPVQFENLIQFGRAVRVLVMLPEGAVANKYLRMGCMGVLHESDSAMILRRALCTIATGELWASRRTISTVIQELLTAGAAGQVSRQEAEILGLLSQGCRNQEIADRLFISRETVRWHLRHLYSKIGVKDRREAVLYATERLGVIPVAPAPAPDAIDSPIPRRKPGSSITRVPGWYTYSR